jgi:Protein of unknown function (DUF4089)
MTTEQQAAYVDATAALLDLAIAPYREGVLRYFALAASMNAVVDGVALGLHDESGDVFAPVVPGSTAA